jgi:hypothetical protein
MRVILFTDVLEMTETEIPNGHTTKEVILDPFHIEAPYV